jgi:hypothetical protein
MNAKEVRDLALEELGKRVPWLTHEELFHLAELAQSVVVGESYARLLAGVPGPVREKDAP